MCTEELRRKDLKIGPAIVFKQQVLLFSKTIDNVILMESEILWSDYGRTIQSSFFTNAKRSQTRVTVKLGEQCPCKLEPSALY